MVPTHRDRDSSLNKIVLWRLGSISIYVCSDTMSGFCCLPLGSLGGLLLKAVLKKSSRALTEPLTEFLEYLAKM